ncbi:MAG: thiamine biosynthesis protein ThiF [Roseburia sp.]
MAADTAKRKMKGKDMEMQGSSNGITWEQMYESLCERHTKEVQDQLLKGKVAIAGLGGLGSNIAVSLARAGLGRLHLIDFDEVEISNLNRQQYRIRDIGKKKTEALAEMIREINPFVELRVDTIKLDAENTKEIFREDDIVCEAFDKAEEKAMLVDAFFSYYGADKILLTGSGMAGYDSSNKIITRKINQRFYLCGDGVNGLESGQSLMAPRVNICAGHEANMVIRLLLGESNP